MSSRAVNKIEGRVPISGVWIEEIHRHCWVADCGHMCEDTHDRCCVCEGTIPCRLCQYRLSLEG